MKELLKSYFLPLMQSGHSVTTIKLMTLERQ